MKNSGIEWIGEIPAEWEVHRIKNNFQIISGSGFKPEYQGKISGDYPVCKASDISLAGKYIESAANYIDIDIAENQMFSIIPKNSILFAKIGEAMKKNNRGICMVDCCTDNNCEALVPNKIDCVFSYYMLLCVDMCWFDNAGTIPSISNIKLLSHKFAYPSLPEQQRIAAYLDAKCGEIDKVMSKTCESIAEYKKLKQSIITEAVTKGVDGERPMKDSGIEWIGEIPAEWEIRKLKYTGSFINGYAFEPSDWRDNGKEIIRIQNLTGSSNTINYYGGTIDEKYNVTKGDVLVSWAASLDAFRWNRNDGWLNQHIFKSVPNTQIVFEAYNYWLLKTAMSYMNNENKHGIMMEHVTLDVFNNFSVPLPSLSEQQRIVAYLDKKCSEIDNLIAKKEQLLTELEKYKKSLIYECVTGKREVG